MPPSRSTFIRRFDHIWQQARRVQLWQALCWSLLASLAGVALLAAADYQLELSRPWRVAGVSAIGVAAFALLAWLVVRARQRWQRNATASAIERVFPQLGQRIRTTVQFGELSAGEISASGATGTLVVALEEDTVRRAQPLPLDAVVPWKSLALASLLAAGVGLLLAGASAFDWQWRIAAQRALLGDEPYTRLSVTPGHTAVKEGESLDIEIVVEGRIGESLSFETRRLDEEQSEWQEEVLPASSGKDAGVRRLAFDVPLAKLRHPLEYRVSAGSAASDVYRIGVRYPLKIVKMRAAIQPPAYTGLDESVVESGDITALVGSRVKLAVELDQPPKQALIEMQDMNRRRDAEAAPERTALAIAGKTLTTEFEVTSDKTYTILATSADGLELAGNKHRLRARQDEPPQVWFENPPEALEVHTLAEILMRVRVSDDFGLARAGVMFEVNNEEEYQLVAEDFVAAAKEMQQTGKLSPQTRAALERVLPLEHFALTQRDSVMYYAFAEDIRPSSPQRSETDMRFIDIRPFKRTYQLIDPQLGNGAQGPELKTLEELIARQRYALNRAIRLSRTYEHTGQADLAVVDSLTKFEAELAKSTRELAQGLEARGIDETELLYQAEAAMLSATDSLTAGKYDTAALQMRDALKNLIEGRDRIRIVIFKNPDRALLAALRAFDRMQRQKLRRPKNDEEAATQIVERLQELADQEEIVYASLAGIDMEAPAGKTPPDATGGKDGEQKPMPDAPKPLPEGDAPPATASAGGDAAGEQPGGGREQRERAKRDLEDRQLDIAAEAKEVEKALAELKGATELAKQRMAAAAKSADEAAGALERGKLDDAKQPAGAARDQFRDLVEQVAAQVAKEQADRIAAAQQMAADLARQQEEFRDQLANSGEGQGDGEPSPDQKRMAGSGPDRSGDAPPKDGPSGSAERIAAKAETLNDVLAAAMKAENPQDQPAAKKVDELVQKLALKALAERLAALPDKVREGQIEDAKAVAGDGAERMEAAAEQLGALRRAMISPQIDELAKLEERLAVLDERLDKLDTQQRITGWHIDADALLDELDAAGIADDVRQELIEEMRAGGWKDSPRVAWNWNVAGGGHYVAPVRYHALLSRLTKSLRERIQDLMLGDMTAAGDEPIPPQYQELVDRYYQLLAREPK